MIIRDLDHHQAAYLQNIEGGSYPMGMAVLGLTIDTIAAGSILAEVGSQLQTITISNGPVKLSGFSLKLGSVAMG
ncbi:MAG: hypothetical protein RLZZ568_184 [Cyanobacteriota bacterium]|jgi:hypothetical protein